MTVIGISLGWNCTPATVGVKTKLRTTKAKGYKTCPFDKMVTNYPNLLRCLQTDFSEFYNPVYLALNKDGYIYHTRYKFTFNHESPGHPTLPTTEAWPGGATHFTANNYANFVIRYRQRVANFRSYLANPANTIAFIVGRFNSVPLELEQVLISKYPTLKFTIHCLLKDDPVLEHRETVLALNPPITSPELQRFIKKPCARPGGRFRYID